MFMTSLEAMYLFSVGLF